MNRPNILFIVLDTARYDVIHEEGIMPNLAQISKNATNFTEAHANAPWTLPSHASIFSGKYPSEHGTGIEENYFSYNRDLISQLNEHDYETVAFSNNPWISPDYGFDQFDTFYPCWQLFQRGDDLAEISQEEKTTTQITQIGKKLFSTDAPFTIANAAYMKLFEGKYDSGAALTNFRIRRWLKKRDDSTPFFAFVNYMEPHLEYDPPKKYKQKLLSESNRSRAKSVNQDPWAHVTGSVEMTQEDFDVLKQLYRAEVRYLDERIGELWKKLQEHGLMDDSTLIITGDHGENIGEFNLMDHQYHLNESLTHVPLYLLTSESVGSASIDDLVELRYLYPTILDIAGVRDHPQNSLLNIDDIESDYAISEYLRPQPEIQTLCDRYGVDYETVEHYDRRLKKLTTKSKALIYDSDGNSELFDRSDGSLDRINEPEPEIVEQLKKDLKERVSDFSEYSASTSTEVSSRLEDLGYL